MFKTAGSFTGTVREVIFAEPKFAKDDANAFDICLRIEGPEGQSDWWRGEMSNKYGRGNFSNKKQTQITIENLRRIGFEGNDLTQLEKQLVGKEIPFTVEAREYDGKTYYDIKYIGDDFRPKEIEGKSISERLKALKGGAEAPATPPPAKQEEEEDIPW